MLARHAVLLTLPSDGNRPSWSYHHTGTLPRLISFVSHSYANTGDVGVFFPFWYTTIGRVDANSPHYSSSFFSHSCARFCAFLHAGWGYPRSPFFSALLCELCVSALSFSLSSRASLSPLLPCFCTSLQYNRCASIRGRNEL